MPHQCVKCSRIIPAGSRELLDGCGNCRSKFYYYISDEQLEQNKEKQNQIQEMPEEEKREVEKDIRDIAGVQDEEAPVILDFETIRAIGEGKFEVDVVNLFNKKKPIVYKTEEGKYMVDFTKNFDK